ncbi:MAG: DUF1499 domain-containing protein [Planctomycetota bacterium]|nr:DUF1499 domain-containing protein [Planctomycetota bacterium]
MSPLPACPPRPSCVSSDAPPGAQHIEPLAFGARTGAAWTALVALLERTPRVELVEVTGTTIHAVFTTRLLRFRDDVNLELREADGLVAVRSCSRVGHSDLGTNRRRVEALREQLTAALAG